MNDIKILIVSILAVITLVVFIVCGFRYKQTMDFKKIKLEITGTRSGSIVYEIEHVKDGLSVQYYFQDSRWDDSKNAYVKTQQMYRSEIIDEQNYEQLCKVLAKCNVRNWDGFSKTNSHVLDGNSFSFKLEQEDGQIISAHGCNSTPKHYREVRDFIGQLCQSELLTKECFRRKLFQIEIPARWLKQVFVFYTEGGFHFKMMIGENEITLLTIHQNEYGYYENDNYTKLGQVKKGESTIYLYYSSGTIPESLFQQANEVQKEILNNLAEDIKKIEESFVSI